MNSLIQAATTEIADFLLTNLPDLDKDWWENRVESRLTFQQQRVVQEQDIVTLKQLDFSALLRVLD